MIRCLLVFSLLFISATSISYAVFSVQAIVVAEYGEGVRLLGHWSVGLFAYCAVMLAALWAGWTAFSRLFWRRVLRNQESAKRSR